MNEGYFPMFVSLAGKKVKVIGAGAIALRRIKTLLPYGCDVTVIAPTALPEIQSLAAEQKLTLQTRAYQAADAESAFFVLAATDSRAVNHQIFLDCKTAGIPVNVCDQKEECDFQFPAVIRDGSFTIGVNGGGSDHRRVRQIADKIRALQNNIFNKE